MDIYCNKDSYLLYFTGYGMYINTSDDTFKIFEKEFYTNSITDISIDTYARSRDFMKIVKFRRPENLINNVSIEFYNNFDKNKDNIDKLINRLYIAKNNIHDKSIRQVPRDKMSKDIIYEILELISTLKKYKSQESQ